MATVTRENIGLLNEKITVTVAKDDYLPTFEKAIKTYSKQANIPGFRKGMVPVGMVKKMYGSSIFADEVIKSVEKGLQDYMSTEKLEIFAQPLHINNVFFVFAWHLWLVMVSCMRFTTQFIEDMSVSISAKSE